MSNFMFPGICLAGLVATGVIVGQNMPASGIDYELQVATIEDLIAENHWVFANRLTDDECTISRTGPATNSSLPVKLEACDEVFRAASRVKFWRQDRSGNVTLADSNGKTLVSFAISEETGLSSTNGEVGALHLMPQS